MKIIFEEELQRYASRQEFLNSLFFYKIGYLYWKKDRGNKIKAGDQAGSINSRGYWVINIYGKLYYTHRIIYEMHFGDTELEVDHIDEIVYNNLLENLREATRSQNQMNVGIRKDNTSGYKGVTWFKKKNKWNAQISINGKHKSLGYYHSIEEAKVAYDKAAQEIYGEFAKSE